MMSQVQGNNIIPPRYKISWQKKQKNNMNINTKQFTLINRIITTYWPLLPRDHNNCSSIALPMSWHHVGDKTSPGPQKSKVMRDISLGQKSPHGQIIPPWIKLFHPEENHSKCHKKYQSTSVQRRKINHISIYSKEDILPAKGLSL